MIHVRFEGRSFDIDTARLAAPEADTELLNRLARYLDVSPDRFNGYVVDRQTGGTIIVRPEAVYG